MRAPDELDAILWALKAAVNVAQQIGLNEKQFLQVVRQTWRIRQDQQVKRLYDDQRIN